MNFALYLLDLLKRQVFISFINALLSLHEFNLFLSRNELPKLNETWCIDIIQFKTQRTSWHVLVQSSNQENFQTTPSYIV